MNFRRSLHTSEQINSATELIRSVVRSENFDAHPRVDIILGTGMAPLADEIINSVSIPYHSIPGFHSSTVSGHAGELKFGEIAATPVIAMNGRCHYYEGFSTAEVCFPIQVLAALGIQKIIIGNASGGLNPKFSSGEVMLIESHLDLMFQGNNSGISEMVSQSVSRSCKREIYSSQLGSSFCQLAMKNNLVLHQGTYAALSGPNYETRSEYRMLRKLGADVVGMSTIPEANTAAQLGMDVVGLSTITNVANPDELTKTTHEEVIEAVAQAEHTLKTLLVQFLS